MKCANCGMRWARFPDTWPEIRLTNEEDIARRREFTNDTEKICPTCEEENLMMINNH